MTSKLRNELSIVTVRNIVHKHIEICSADSADQVEPIIRTNYWNRNYIIIITQSNEM